MIVGTAGHIDHGKTALVRALTGVDTDRLPEEKERGMSIDLGFAYHDVGLDQPLGFVDVPGHEKFIRNMVAGVAGIDYLLLVVAADDGVMPQTLEHLAIVRLLGLAEGIAAVTKIDAVEPDRVERVSGDVRALLDSAGLSAADVVATSIVSGEGVATLRSRLADAARAGPARPAGGHFRLAIDRCFTVRGAGTVVTGTAMSGHLRRGDELMLSPPGIAVRAREIHVHNRPANECVRGHRCAVNVKGRRLDRTGVERGTWLVAPPLHAPTTVFDARLGLAAGERQPLRHWTPVHVHIGTAEAMGRVATLEGDSIEPDREGHVQIVLERAVNAVAGDRFVIRDQSARRTLGGGRVIDPFADRRRRRSSARHARLRALDRRDDAEALRALLALDEGGVDIGRFARMRNLTGAEMQSLLASSGCVTIEAGTAALAFSASRWSDLGTRLLTALDAYHRRHPDHPGMPLRALTGDVLGAVPPVAVATLVDELAGHGRLETAASKVRLPGHRPNLPDDERSLRETLWKALHPADGQAPKCRQLATMTGIAESRLRGILADLAGQGDVFRVTADRYLPADTVRDMATAVHALAQRCPGRQAGIGDIRRALGIGRNLLIEVLEYFDRTGFTTRIGNSRRVRCRPDTLYGP